MRTAPGHAPGGGSHPSMQPVLAWWIGPGKRTERGPRNEGPAPLATHPFGGMGPGAVGNL